MGVIRRSGSLNHRYLSHIPDLVIVVYLLLSQATGKLVSLGYSQVQR